MTDVTAWFLALALPALAYEWLVRVQMAKPIRREPTYNAVFARVLHRVTAKRIRYLSLWRTCWAKYPHTDPRGKMSAEEKRHEFEGHIENEDQWAGHPRSYPFRYVWRLIVYGYDKHPDEQQARKIAGQPLR